MFTKYLKTWYTVRGIIVLLLINAPGYSFQIDNTPGVRGENPRIGVIRIASCQFPVSSNIGENAQWIGGQMVEAKLKGANIVQFPECALPGYAGVDMESLDSLDWGMLFQFTDFVMGLAKELGIWVVLGSIHKLSPGHKPHNCLYVISPEGEIVDRYDKRFCTGRDLTFFTPGDHFCTFEVNGVNCGLLICYDVRFPELYRGYRKLGADLIFHSFYNARKGKGAIFPQIMPPTIQTRAATNYFYVSTSNSSSQESWPCHFVTPDGLVRNKLEENTPGVLISDIDISEKYYDASKGDRDKAIDGRLSNGEAIDDTRSENHKGY